MAFTLEGNPVVTSCGHYFCQQCALKRHKVNRKCAVCDKQTGGLFNGARKLIAKLEAAKALDAGKAQGDEGDGEEGGAAAAAAAAEERPAKRAATGSWS